MGDPAFEIPAGLSENVALGPDELDPAHGTAATHEGRLRMLPTQREGKYHRGTAGWCKSCGRPVMSDGTSAKLWRGVGRPCSGCGWRPKKNFSPSQVENMSKNLAVSDEEADRREAAGEVGVKRASEMGAQGSVVAKRRRGELRVTDVMRKMVEDQAETVVAPYFAGLELEVREEWSPSTKLEFYLNQSQLADKLLNRVEGTPTQRVRRVTKEDDDVLPSGDDLTAGSLAAVVAGLVAGGLRPGREETVDAEDGDWSEVEQGELGP